MNLTEYIAQDLQARIARGELASDELTLVSLAKHYDVSLTPVRGALDGLVQRGILKRHENGRVAVSQPVAAGSAEASLPQPARMPPRDAHAWADELGRRIARLSLVGEQVFLREEQTAGQLGIGRTLLRQIFHRLSGQGLLKHVPRRGWQVRAFATSDLDDYLVVRETLERLAMDLAKDRVDRQQLTRMLSGNQTSPVSDHVPPTEPATGPVASLDNRLHAYFIETAGNRYIREFFQRHGPYFTQIFDMAAPETQVVCKMADQHCQVLQAALDGDWESAKSAMGQHIRDQRGIVQQLISQVRASWLRSATDESEWLKP